MPTIAPPSPMSGRSAADRALSEYALVWNACAALSTGVSRNLPPSASSGANAIACSTPSTRPQRSRRSAATDSMSEAEFTSSSRTSAGCGSWLAARSVSRLARPKPVSTTSAPASWACRAASKAIESRFRTPVMRSFLSPSTGPTSSAGGSQRDVAHAVRGDCDGVERRERLDQPAPGVVRGDHLVDVALGGGDARRQVLGRVLGGEALARGAGIVGAGDVAPAHDADRLLGAHDAELRLRPREREVRAEVARVHRDERAAERLAQHDGDLRDARLGER